METYNESYYKNMLARLLRISLTNTEPAKELMERMFHEEEFKSQAACLCDSYRKPEYRNSVLISKTIDVRALSALVRICKRDKLGIIPLDFSGEENHVYENGDRINVLILSQQELDFEKAAIEACAVSGVVDEILRTYADTFALKLKNENPLVEISGVSDSVYQSMKNQIGRLPYVLRFTLFPENTSDGKINVGFFTKTEAVTFRNEKDTKKYGPYLIPKIASIILACSLLENPELDEEYEKKMKKNKEIMNAIVEMFYGSEEPIYLIPATVGKDGLLNVFMDKYGCFEFPRDSCTDYAAFDEFVKLNMSGINHTLVPMTEQEYETYKSEITIHPKAAAFYNASPTPEYISPESMRDMQISDRLIDILNKKREEILLISDDFNGSNLTNIENYITGTVHEIVMREDEDYTDWVEKEEILDSKEMEYLAELEEAYSISYAYEDHDKVSQLICKEIQNLEAFRSKADCEEVDKSSY